MTVLRDYAAGLTQPPLDSVDAVGLPVVGPAYEDPAGGADRVRYDEVFAPDGALRPAWNAMAGIAVGWTEQDLRRVDDEIVGRLADDGVTYSRPGDRTAPWRLDPLPLVLDSASWSPLEVGLAQRAELLNAVLLDLYGEQRLLAEGIVPAPVVHGHAGYLRSLVRPTVPDSRPLLLTATDLGRDAEGQWRVVGDRAQAPSGIGYAMENRRVISRVLPELYREAGLHRIEPYFWALRSALIQSAHGDLGDPRVVVLSPGTHSETAYDQSFVASMLGFPLVQGSDLVVRDGWVMMRTFGRLERVDVILRRVDATFSDPLELRGDSRLGVAGLVEAVRRGRVRVVNGLGAGVLENPGLLPYLPAACEALLGEPLRLPAVPTWWLGDPASMDHVRGHEESYELRSLDRSLGQRVDLPPERLWEQVRAEPQRWVAQERLPLSQAPTWPGGVSGALLGAQPRPVMLRAFTLRYGAAYRPLVGGLASVLPGAEDREGRSVASKDVWVLKADPADADQGLSEVLPVTRTRSLTALVPRALEDLYWAGRYAERTEDLLRLVVAAHELADAFRSRPRSAGGASLGVVMQAVGALAGRVHEDLDQELRSILLDPARPGSAAQGLAGLRDALEGVRDQLSPDTWRAFGVTERATTALVESPHGAQVADSAGRMLTGVLSFQGVVASMIRDAGWHMIGAGRALERGLQLVRLLRATTTVRRGLDVDRAVLDAVLVAAESSITHRRRYRGYVRPAGVLDLLLMDADNPRSLLFTLRELRTHLAAMPASTGSTQPERLVEDLLADLERVEVSSLVAIGGVGRPHLERFLDGYLAQLSRVADTLREVHLASGPAPRPLGTFTPVEEPVA